MLGLILGALNPIEKITTAIVKARADGLNATTEQEKIAAQERVSTLQARRDVLIAEAGVSKANLIVRAIFAVPIIVVIWKLLVWDKVVGSLVGCSSAPRGTCGIFTTDPFDDNQWKIIMIVIGFYFLYEGAIGVTRIAKR
jgi:hypothetical protein